MNVLVIAPHADDEVIGVGGTILRHIAEGDSVFVCIVTRGTEPLFSDAYMQNLRKETLDCHKKLGIQKTLFLEYPSVMLENEKRYELNAKIRDVVCEIGPDVVYIPHWGDMQKDHQIVAEAAMVALRPKYEKKVSRIYAYETLSETGWNIPTAHNCFIPTSYVNIGEHLKKKLEAMRVYQSQLDTFPGTRSIEAIESLARYRGSVVGFDAAEAFTLVREIW